MDYKNAGVDIEAGYESVELMKKYVKGTMRPEVLGGLGGFSGAFSMEAIKGMEEPVLLSGTDGSVLTVSQCVSMILPAQAVNHYFSWIISHVAKTIRRRSQRS